MKETMLNKLNVKIENNYHEDDDDNLKSENSSTQSAIPGSIPSTSRQSYASVLVSGISEESSSTQQSSNRNNIIATASSSIACRPVVNTSRRPVANNQNALVVSSNQINQSSVFLTPPDSPPINGINTFDNKKKNKFNNDIGPDQNEFLKKRKLDEKEKLLIISGHANFPWSKIKYTPTSIRELEPIQKKIDSFTLSDKLDQYLLKFPKNPKEIAITGITGSGKTTLANMFVHRKYIKVNILNQSITKGVTYNVLPKKCLDYLFTNATTTFNKPVVWDRTMYDNLVFYLVHFLMGYYKDTAVTSNYKQIVGLMLEWAHSVNLNKIISYMKTIKQIPQIFIISSDIDIISKSLFFRNDTINSVSYSIDYNYLMCQHHALRFFAETLNDFIIDFNHLDMNDIKTLSDLQALLVYKLDYNASDDNDDDDFGELDEQIQLQQQQPQLYNKINLSSTNELTNIETLDDAKTTKNDDIDDDFFCFTPNPLIYDELDLFNSFNLIYKLSKK